MSTDTTSRRRGGADTGRAAGPPHRRRFRITVAVLVLLLAAAMAGIGAVLMMGPPGGADAESAGATGATAEVERTTLQEAPTVDGTLGYRGAGQVFAAEEGLVTWVPEVGGTVDPGEPVYKVDGRPVVLLRGDEPAYRTLRPGDRGEDVRRFEQALSELGYSGFTPDSAYTALTAAAVRLWQRDAGLPVTGEADPASVWFAPGPLRVAGAQVEPGERTSPSSPVLDTTATDRVVEVELEAADRGMVDKGDDVEVEMPRGGAATGTVASIGDVAKEEDSGGEGGPGPGGEGSDAPVIDVVVELDEGGDDFFDRAAVEVRLAGDSVEDVLAVPVGALIAMPGGGYGVTLAGKGGATRDVTVETGMFADGKVEISGDGVAEGDEVVVPE